MDKKKKLIFCTPSLAGPTKPYIESLEASLPLLEAAGWEHQYAQKVGCPYISEARANLTRAALDTDPDLIVFLDYDLSWQPEDLVKLIYTDGEVVAGTYRPKFDPEEYMGVVKTNEDHTPVVRPSDGAIAATMAPAGFLKITPKAIDKFMKAYPELTYGPMYHLSVDLFNHGVHEHVWWGEDYRFSQRWCACGGELWIVPDLNLTHHFKGKAYPGNFHQFLLRQPGGSNDPALVEALHV